MKSALGKGVRRFAALSLLAGLILILWMGLVEPVVDYLDTAAVARGISLRAVKRNRALLRQAPAMREAQTSVAQSPRWAKFYEAEKPEAATLQMEADVRAILQAINTPVSMVAQPSIARGVVSRIAVRVSLSMRIDQLAEVLDRIQKNPRQLRVETLIIQAPDAQSGASSNPLFTVQAEISALYATRPAGPGAAT